MCCGVACCIATTYMYIVLVDYCMYIMYVYGG